MDIKVTTFKESFPRVGEMIHAHRKEVTFGPWNDLELDINEEVYIALEEEGLLRTVIAEEGDEVVGYLVIICGSMNHHKEVWNASSDVIYVSPEYRSTGVAAEMIKVMMEDCKDHGVSFLSIGVNTNLDFSEILEKNGAVLTEKQYTWRL